MDNGASSYRRFLDGDDSGLAELVRDYKDGLILYLNGFVQNMHTAEELMEDTEESDKEPEQASISDLVADVKRIRKELQSAIFEIGRAHV